MFNLGKRTPKPGDNIDMYFPGRPADTEPDPNKDTPLPDGVEGHKEGTRDTQNKNK